MAWDYERGREATKPYPNVGFGPHSPDPPKFWKRGQAEINHWEGLEVAWKKKRYGTSAPPSTLICAWEAAEMALMDWSQHSKKEDFRRGYLEWLAANGGAADALSDLEIEQLPMLERIIARGYREMAKVAHPDTGGSKEAFHELRNAKTQLDRMLLEVGDLLKDA